MDEKKVSCGTVCGKCVAFSLSFHWKSTDLSSPVQTPPLRMASLPEGLSRCRRVR